MSATPIQSVPVADVCTLEARNVTKRFGGVTAVNGVTFRARQDEIVGLIGPNGAGKTTLFNLMSGFFAPNEGDIYFKGERITGLRPYEVARRGLARTFQICKPFPDLSVLENVVTGAYGRAAGYAEAVEASENVLDQLGLYHRRLQLARHLTLPDLKRLEVARALATAPAFLLLDEVMAGLNLKEQHEVAAMIEKIHSNGVGVVLVEHSIAMIVRLSRHVVVMDDGRHIAEGAPREAISTKAVRAAYLGLDDDSPA
jgi:branched-chain amino acid transport system ATP-binding protein